MERNEYFDLLNEKVDTTKKEIEATSKRLETPSQDPKAIERSKLIALAKEKAAREKAMRIFEKEHKKSVESDHILQGATILISPECENQLDSLNVCSIPTQSKSEIADKVNIALEKTILTIEKAARMKELGLTFPIFETDVNTCTKTDIGDVSNDRDFSNNEYTKEDATDKTRLSDEKLQRLVQLGIAYPAPAEEYFLPKFTLSSFIDMAPGSSCQEETTDARDSINSSSAATENHETSALALVSDLIVPTSCDSEKPELRSTPTSPISTAIIFTPEGEPSSRSLKRAKQAILSERDMRRSQLIVQAKAKILEEKKARELLRHVAAVATSTGTPSTGISLDAKQLTDSAHTEEISPQTHAPEVAEELPTETATPSALTTSPTLLAASTDANVIPTASLGPEAADVSSRAEVPLIPPAVSDWNDPILKVDDKVQWRSKKLLNESSNVYLLSTLQSQEEDKIKQQLKEAIDSMKLQFSREPEKLVKSDHDHGLESTYAPVANEEFLARTHQVAKVKAKANAKTLKGRKCGFDVNRQRTRVLDRNRRSETASHESFASQFTSEMSVKTVTQIETAEVDTRFVDPVKPATHATAASLSQGSYESCCVPKYQLTASSHCKENGSHEKLTDASSSKRAASSAQKSLLRKDSYDSKKSVRIVQRNRPCNGVAGEGPKVGTMWDALFMCRRPNTFTQKPVEYNANNINALRE